jgi:two-component system chemotaxis response regulator CheY
VHRNGVLRPTLLLAEDDAASARLLARVLTQAGYDVEPVLTGREALARLTASRFDVLICDWTLPDIDGIAVVRHVRSKLAVQPIILLVSSFSGEGARQQALRAGADDYVSKPFEPLSLLDVITTALARRAAGAGSATIADFPPPPNSSVSKAGSDDIGPGRAAKRAPARIEGTAAWRGLPHSIATTLRDGLGVDIKYEQASLCESGENMSAAVFMINVSHLIEVAAALFVSWNSGAELARIILRDANPDDVAIRELLVELGSNVLGTLKTALRRDGLLFTLGLGHPAGMPLASGFARSFDATWVGGFTAPGLRITTVFGSRPIAKVAMPLRKLKENMVLAEDLVSEGGTVILAAGSRLTSSTAERLGAQFGHRTVQVCLPPTEW